MHLKDLTFSEVHIEMGLVPAVHVLWEDKSAASAKATTGATSTLGSSSSSPFASSRSSFTSSSSLGSSSSFADRYRAEKEAEEEELAEILEDSAEIKVETETAAEVESEEPATDKGKTPTKKRAGRRVSTSTQDPEDDKLVGFPDVSFPSGD